MAVALSCPHCQSQLKLKRQPPSHKKTARCPQCKGAVPLFPLSDEQSGISSKSPESEDFIPKSSEKCTQPKRQAVGASGKEKGEENFLAPPQQPDEIGRLGPYRVLSRIGVGGMGMVFRAEDPSLKRQVALKVMLPQCASNPRRKERFLREAHAQARVEHEHIVAIFDAEPLGGVAYIAMPLLKGQSLFSALMQNPRPPLKEVLRIGREMAEGLAAAHEVGLIHRDIKPSNIWLDGKRRRVKILDFGLARVADTTEVGDLDEDSNSASAETGDAALTVQGAVLGTPLYMSPEQARGEKTDHRTDIFSLGIILYQMTTGSNPFNNPKTAAILEAVKNLNPPSPSIKNPEVTKPVSDLILHLLAKSVADRPDTAEEVAETLQQLETSLDSADIPLATPVLAPDDPWSDLDTTEESTLTTSAAPTPLETRKAKPRAARKRRPFLILGAVAAVVVAAAIAVVLTSSSKRPTPQPQPQPQPEPEPVTAKSTPPASKAAVVKKAFAWPADALREGRIPLMDLSTAKLLKGDEFDNLTSGWPQNKLETQEGTVLRGYKDGTYLLKKDFDGGVSVRSNQFVGFSTFVCQLDGRVVDDPSASWELSFGNDQQRKAITLKLNAAGKLKVVLTENDNDEQEPLFSGTHVAIRKGNEFNRLAVIYTAERLEVYVNGVAVCDPLSVPVRLQPVNIALGLSGGGKSSAEFRRLTVSSADGLPTPEERLKNREVPVKDSFRLPFTWTVAALREGRVTLPDLGMLKLLKTDDFKDPTTGWPQGKSENKGIAVQRGYKDGTYFIRKEYDSGWSYGGSSQFVGFSSIVCQAEGRVVDDKLASWDLWFGSEQQRKAIIVRLNGVGIYRVVLWDYDKGDQVLLQAGTHSAITRGNEFNKVTVIYTVDRLEVFVNGIAVCDPVLLPIHLQTVRLALGISGGVKSTTEFRRLSIWSTDGLPTPEERIKTGAVPLK